MVNPAEFFVADSRGYGYYIRSADAKAV